jgi:hypothetical protein
VPVMWAAMSGMTGNLELRGDGSAR